jgi:hypothetical protein
MVKTKVSVKQLNKVEFIDTRFLPSSWPHISFEMPFEDKKAISSSMNIADRSIVDVKYI